MIRSWKRKVSIWKTKRRKKERENKDGFDLKIKALELKYQKKD